MGGGRGKNGKKEKVILIYFQAFFPFPLHLFVLFLINKKNSWWLFLLNINRFVEKIPRKRTRTFD